MSDTELKIKDNRQISIFKNFVFVFGVLPIFGLLSLSFFYYDASPFNQTNIFRNSSTPKEATLEKNRSPHLGVHPVHPDDRDSIHDVIQHDLSNALSAIKIARDLGLRFTYGNDGGIIALETIEAYINGLELVKNTRDRMRENGQDVYEFSLGEKGSSLNDEMYLDDDKKSIQGLLISLYCDLSKIYFIANMFEKSLDATSEALLIDPNYIDALCQRGLTSFTMGMYDESKSAYGKVLELGISVPVAYLGMAKVLKVMNTSAEEWASFVSKVENNISEYEKMIQYLTNLDDEKILSNGLKELHKSLFTYHDSVTKNAQQAFYHLSEAYRLKMKYLEPYNKSMVEQQNQVIKSVFTQQFFPTGVGSQSSSLIFVIGFPRCGSTLVERILDAHSEIIGTGEDSVFNSRLAHIRNAVVLASQSGSLAVLRQVIQENADHVEELVHSRWRKFQSDSDSDKGDPKKFVDKMLTNYANVGFIHLLFPKALILHISRDPMSTLWSAFHHEFPPGFLDYTCQLDSLAHIYNEYIALVDHWDRVLPGRITHIRYEDIVNRPDTMMKSIIAATGLEWEEGIKEFHNRKKSVNTMSTSQVRKKIFNDSNVQWKPYESFLQTLRESIGTNVAQKYSTTLNLIE